MKILTIGKVSVEITNLEAIYEDKGYLIIELKNNSRDVKYNLDNWPFQYTKISDIIIEAESQYTNYHIKIVHKYSTDIPKNPKEFDNAFYYIIEGSKF